MDSQGVVINMCHLGDVLLWIILGKKTSKEKISSFVYKATFVNHDSILVWTHVICCAYTLFLPFISSQRFYGELVGMAILIPAFIHSCLLNKLKNKPSSQIALDFSLTFSCLGSEYCQE